ncbi:MAG: hypothetical protein COV70_02290 [Parcubacteria group bacterium CG11_big_fil_rev_8_21_14_0_20_39_22]|nr:MAG: hypothetical protein COV70_02290 [Parcubacteria group bacterium CG11_big_fil_rev_8_21_14_0_20_39_22]
MKTLFVELFSVAAAPHLLSEGGLVSKLKDKNVRIILLIPSLEEYKKMAAPHLQENVIFEEIKKTFPSTYFQKVFVFFYSYLIFTGTTKMLATFGARADSPPAGGNRHLAWLKSLLANTFGRSKWIKVKAVPWLYQRIFNERPYRELFEKHSPDAIFVSNIAFNPALELISEAKRMGVKSMGMAANWDHLNKYYIPMHADHLLVQNEPMSREAVEYHTYDPKQVSIVGFPQFDKFADLDLVKPKEEYFKEFGIPLDHKILLHFSGSVYALDEADILEEVAKWINDGVFGPATLMVRPYAGLRERKQEEEKYKRLLNMKNVVFNWRQDNDSSNNKANYVSMFAYADIIISVFSTTAIEASIFDKPTVTIGFDGYENRPFHKSIKRLETLSHFKHVLDTGSVYVARNFENLQRKISEYISDPVKDREQRKNLISKMCFKIDGKSNERIADFIISKI